MTQIHASLKTFARPLAITGLALLAGAILANSMTKPVGRDEQMYCTAGALLAQGQMIYRDFSYPSQLPYHPLLLAGLYRALGTTRYLLVGRLVAAVSDILLLVIIVAIYRRAFREHRVRGWLLGMAAAVLYVFNPLVDYAIGYAWNHDVVILCVAASLWLFLATDFEHKSRFWRIALVGLLLTIATFMRVTTILVELLFLAAILWTAGGSWKNRILTALPFLPAAGLAAIWPLRIMAHAPEAFCLNLVRIPTLYGQWLHEKGFIFSKLALTAASLLTPGYLVLLLVAASLIWVACRRPLNLNACDRRKMALTALLPLILFLIAYIPPTVWQQYLAVPVPFLVIAFACPLAALQTNAGTPGKAASWLMGIGAVVAVIANPLVLARTPAILIPEAWTPVTLHKQAQDIAAAIKEPRLVLTLGPLYAIEGGCNIYPELAGGDIIYRIADRLSPGERQLTHTVGPETLDELVAARPPAAILVGIEPSYFSSLEDPLRQLAPSEWRRETLGGTLQLYSEP